MAYKTAVLSFKKNLSPVRLFALAAIAVLGFGLIASLAHADLTPTLSLVPVGDGNSVTVNVTGDPNEAVELFYPEAGSGSEIAFLGDTNSQGILSATVSSSQDGIVTSAPVHVAVGGINGTISATEYWPSVSSTSLGGEITLSTTSMVLSVGQSSSVSVTNGTSGTLYSSNNSNPSVANVSVSGDEVTASGIAYGSTTVTICSTTNTTNCPSLYITVENSGAGTLSFSQSTLTVAPGQSVPITVSGGDSDVYVIQNNSNPSVIYASVAGSTVTLSTTSTYGTAALTVCTADDTSCGIINATAGTATSGVVTFSQQYPTLTVGQSMSIAIYGGSSYYISANTNPNSIGASISGTVLTLSGITTGTSTITVCASTGGCGTISATTSYTSSGGALSLSQSVLSIISGQTQTVTISGGNAPYTLTTPSTAYYQASISGNLLSVTGLEAGSTEVAVCSSAGGCTWLTLDINGSGSTSGTLSLSQSSVTVSPNQSMDVTIYGSGSYYVSSNSNPSVATASVSGDTIYVTATSITGSDTMSICQEGGACATLYVTVGTATTTGALSFSQSSLTLGVGQNTAVTIYGSGTYYISSNSNQSVASAGIDLDAVNITGVSAGSDTLTICQNGGACSSIYISVSGSGAVTASGTASLLSFGTPLESLGIGQSATVAIVGGTGSYYIAYSSNPGAVTANVVGNTLSLSGLQSNSVDVVVVCSSSNSCGALPVAIGVVTSLPATTTTTTTTAASGYVFTNYLTLGSRGTEVLELQERLNSLGYFNGPETGYFGALTEAGVKAFQSAHGIAAVGYVGPSTRAALNQ